MTADCPLTEIQEARSALAICVETGGLGETRDSVGRDWKHQEAAKDLYHEADRFMTISSLIHQQRHRSTFGRLKLQERATSRSMVA